MRLTIQNTDRITEINGVPARIWEGKTDTGIPVFCLITRVGVQKDQDCTQFEDELMEQPAPCSDEVSRAIPSRLIV